MKAVLASEIAKLRTLRSTWFLLAVTVALSLVVTALVVRSPGHDRLPGVTDVMTGPTAAQVLVTLLGARAVTDELRTGTIWASYLAVPSWRRILAGKAVVVAALALVTGAVLVAAGMLVGFAMEGPDGIATVTAHDWRQLLAMPVGFSLGALAGMAVGLVLKSGGKTIAVLLVWMFVAEPSLGATGELLLGLNVMGWLPFMALADFLGQPGGAGFVGGPYAAGVYVAAVIAAVSALGLRLQRRREP
ncbi:hypothetical protein JNUCC64_03390 [Streptomyces sp. JNUCC 64]